MKKLILLCGFGLLGTFALAANEVVEDGTIVKEVTENSIDLVIDESVVNYTIEDCGCRDNPEGTCTITVYGNGFGSPPTGTYTYYNVSYAACKQLAMQHAGYP